MTVYYRRRLITTVFALAMASVGLMPRQAMPAWSVGKPIVMFWGGEVTDSVAQMSVNGGYNIAWVRNGQQLALAQRYGLRAMYQDLDGILTPASLDGGARQAQLNSLIDQFKSSPAAYSYLIKDEPIAADFSGLGNLVAYIRQRDPNHLAFINLNPNYADVGPYGSYVDQYVSTVQPSLLSYDHYQLKNSSDGSGYLENLNSISLKAKQSGIPFINTVQACEWYTSWRNPNANELRFLAYSTMAYGAQGISYYCYSNYKNIGPDTGGLVYNGETTSTYAALTPINREFVKIAGKYQGMNWIGTYLKGYSSTSKPPGTTLLPSNAPFSISGVEDRTYSSGSPLKGALLGLFGKNGSALGDATSALVQNLDYSANKTYTVTGPGNLSVFHSDIGLWEAKGSNQVALNLQPGGGVLVGLSANADIEVLLRDNFEAHSIGSNLGSTPPQAGVSWDDRYGGHSTAMQAANGAVFGVPGVVARVTAAHETWGRAAARSGNEKIAFELDVCVDGSVPGGGISLATFEDTDYNGGTFALNMNSDGSVVTYGAGGYVTRGTLSTDAWQHVRLVLDFNTDTYSGAVGSLTIPVTGFRTDTGPAGTVGYFYAKCGIPGQFFAIDNVFIYEVPEPSTIVLFGSGILFVLVHCLRKRR